MPDFEPSPRLMDALASHLRGKGYRLKRVAQAVRRLSDLFVRSPDPPGEYLLNPDHLAAYIAYYLPLTALKVRRILEELKLYNPDFLDSPRRILDFGSGPGSALLGLAECSTVAHSAVAVDRVPNALEAAVSLVSELTPFSLEVSSIRPPGPYDLIFAANVYGELDSDSEILDLLEQLDPKGYLVLIEPATRRATQRVMEFRDTLADAGWKIAAPCLDMARCPMVGHKKLWCHQDVAWRQPAWIQRLDQRTGLRPETLKFSYLVVTREGAALKGSARIVSNLHREKGKMWSWLCGGGPELARCELLKRHIGPHNRAYRGARRGEVLEISNYESAPAVRLAGDAEIRIQGRTPIPDSID